MGEKLKYLNHTIPELKLALRSNFCIFSWMISPVQTEESNLAKNGIRHIVCLKFKNDASSEQIREIEQKFPALQESIPGIVSIEWGTNNSRKVSIRISLIVSSLLLTDEEARSNYLPHPNHQAFVDILKPLLDDVFVIDFNL